jgi:hypothetical protein
VAIGDQQPRCHQTQAIGGPGYKEPTHPAKCLKGARTVNPKAASTDANSALGVMKSAFSRMYG